MSRNHHNVNSGGGPYRETTDPAQAQAALNPTYRASSAQTLPEPPPLTFRCLCGQVSGVIDGNVGGRRVCSCCVCKKVTGGTHADVLVIDEGQLRIDRSRLTSFMYEDPHRYSNNARINRCIQCGTTIFSEFTETTPSLLKVFVLAVCAT
ncbi:hypothetical protein GGR52DRAFT_568089 [Hypoxylon sp. FL1284]|nr:hypothetical protein GGR52DRAFT_568089 [Hypoxylon sp. FL1284]